MSLAASAGVEPAGDEITALIERLHDTEQRLAELTAGEVDTVANQDGRMFMLRRAQEQMRRSETEKQNAILNAVPANIALLDAQGLIVSVNKAWRHFAATHRLGGSGHGVGLTHAELCKAVCCGDTADAQRMDRGIRSVLEGRDDSFEIEYAVRATPQMRTRWFLMTATPLDGTRSNGIVVMYVDVSAEKQGHQDLKASELRFRQMADSVGDAFFLRSVDRSRMYYMSPAYETIWGRSCASLYADPGSLMDAVHPDDLQAVLAIPGARHDTGFDVEHRILRPDGEVRWVRARGFPVFNDAGHAYRTVGVIADITDRKRAEQDLLERKAMLNMAGRLSQVGAWSVELPPERVIWTEVLTEIHEEPVGFSPSVEQALSYYVPEHVQMMQAAFEACVRDGTPFDVEHQIITARGRRVWVRAIGEAVRGEGGAICRIQGALQDLTERKQREEETRQLARRLSNTLESLSDGFFTVDRDWRYTYLNGEAERVIGHRRDGLLGRIVWQVFPDAMGTVFEDGFRRAMGGETGIAFEALYAPWDKWIGVNCYPTEEGLSVYFRDVSGRRAALQQLQLLEASVSQLNDIVMITAASRESPSPAIVFVNDAFVRITGYSREEALGRSPGMLSGPLTDRGELDRIRTARERFEPVHAELLNYNKDGRPYWIELDIIPVGTEGKGPWHFVAIQREITQRKRDQEMLRDVNTTLEARVQERTSELHLALGQADQANRAKTSFLATISHEIRTPMNGVIGMIDVLERSNLQASQVEIVKIARESAYALLGIVDDVLDFSKIEAGQFQIDSEPMDLAAQVEGVCDTLDHMAQGKGVTLHLFTDPEIPPRTLGDAARLRQVLLNLTGNAIKFSSGQQRAGRVSVRARLAERRGADGASPVVVELIVTDNGIGIDAETLPRLFSPFTQADAGTTRRFGGTGLGLSISRRLAELMGGEIGVRSQFGQGSTFTVRLPLAVAPADARPHSQVTAPAFDLAGLPCLVLGAPGGLTDDLMVYLRHAGAAAQQAPNAAAAVTWPDRCRAGICVAVVLSDPAVGLDRLLEQCRALTKSRPALQLRLVVIEAGRRRRPRLQGIDLVSLDGEALHRSVFLRAVALAAGMVDGRPATAAGIADTLALPGTMPSLRVPGGGRHLRILVAEDNEINQKVLRKQLALLGYEATIVGTGQEALAFATAGEFGLLLTDLHMPNMDGYELAAAVRTAEAGKRRMPIVALTANAVKGEARRCLDIGMDDYMTKPVQLAALMAMLHKWLDAATPSAPDPHAPAGIALHTDPSSAPTSVADLKVLAALVGDDPTVVGEVLLLFRTMATTLGDQIREGVAGGQLKAVADAAHSLKSSARSIGAWRTGALCDEIEQAAENGQKASMRALVRRFDIEMQALDSYLDSASQPAVEPAAAAAEGRTLLGT